MIDRTKGFFDEEQETMPAARRAEVHRELLRETIRHAYEHAPATRRKMDGAGVRPQDVRELADLRRIPLTKKADLKHIQKGEPPFGGLAALPPRAMRRIYVSPGPTFDPEGRGATHWRWEKPYYAAGFRVGDIVQNTFMYHFSPAGLMFDEALQRIGCTVIPAGVGNTEMQAQVMKELSVTGDEEAAVAAIARGLDAEFAGGRILLDGEEAGLAIRAEEVSVAASRVAALPAVREALLARQREFRRAPGLVADGRDMGSVVFPDAALKVFLTASAEGAPSAGISS